MAGKLQKSNEDDVDSYDEDQDNDSIASSKYGQARPTSQQLTTFVALPPLFPTALDRYTVRDLEEATFSNQLIDIENQRRKVELNNQLILHQAEKDTMEALRFHRLTLAAETDQNKMSLNKERTNRLTELAVADDIRNRELVKSSIRTTALTLKEGQVLNQFQEDRIRRRDDQLALEKKYRDERDEQIKMQAYNAEMNLKDMEHRNILNATAAEKMASIYLRTQDERNQQHTEQLANRRREEGLSYTQRQEYYKNLERAKTDGERERLQNREMNLQKEEMLKSDGIREREATYTEEVRKRYQIRQDAFNEQNLYKK